MANILPIIKHPDARLYTTCELFNFETDKKAMLDLRATYRNAQGGKALGLAMPQIGVLKCCFVMHIQGIETIVVNPLITHMSDEKLLMQEGCLSIPWLTNVMVERPVGIKGYFFTGAGEVAEFELDGMEARVFQHEFDHLIGVTLYTHKDRMSRIVVDTPFQ
jgi:peptide deformylase